MHLTYQPGDDAPTGVFTPPDLSGTTLGYDRRPLAHHGPDHGYVYPGRGVFRVPGRTWQYAPEQCPREDTEILAQRWVVCSGCGLDGS